MKKFFLSSFIFLFLIGSVTAQQDRSLPALEQRALAYIVRAHQVVAYANKLMELKSDRESAEIFTELYLQAARLYGDASRTLKAIGPVYVHQDVVDRFADAERDCLDVVDQTRRLLNKGEIVGVSDWEIKQLMRKIEELKNELPE